mmetsp:Transcript_3430/g.4092  ORF Transcript_3430/g.4092 Transcript_3430/m.4092 type:complete len:113 (-) Transcript_3430:109-447(-)
MTLLSMVAAIESMLIKWVALYIDTYFFNVDCSLNETECIMSTVVWTGSLLRNIGFTILALIKLKSIACYVIGDLTDPELRSAPINKEVDVDAVLNDDDKKESLLKTVVAAEL